MEGEKHEPTHEEIALEAFGIYETRVAHGAPMISVPELQLADWREAEFKLERLEDYRRPTGDRL